MRLTSATKLSNVGLLCLGSGLIGEKKLAIFFFLSIFCLNATRLTLVEPNSYDFVIPFSWPKRWITSRVWETGYAEGNYAVLKL